MSSPEESLPRRISLDRLNKILLAYLRAGGDIEAVNYKEAAERSGISHVIVSLNNKFFVDAGFLKQEKAGTFKLTQNAIEYARAMDWGRLDDARGPLQKIVNEYSLFGKIIDFVKINESVSREDLVGRTASIAGAPKTRGYKRGINTVIDLILFSGLLKQEDDMISATQVARFGKPPIEKITPIPIGEAPPVGREITFPINITINVSQDTSAEKFKELMQIVKEVFGRRLEEIQD